MKPLLSRLSDGVRIYEVRIHRVAVRLAARICKAIPTSAEKGMDQREAAGFSGILSIEVQAQNLADLHVLLTIHLALYSDRVRLGCNRIPI